MGLNIQRFLQSNFTMMGIYVSILINLKSPTYWNIICSGVFFIAGVYLLYKK